jgi:hypothetical protein
VSLAALGAAESILDPKLLENFNDLTLLASDMQQFSSLDETTQQGIVARASELQLAIFTMAQEKLQYTNKQLEDLRNAFRKLTYKC